MALIKCPECGKEISDKSKQCIHCGYPLEDEREVAMKIKLYAVRFVKFYSHHMYEKNRFHAFGLVEKINGRYKPEAERVNCNAEYVIFDGLSEESAKYVESSLKTYGCIIILEESSLTEPSEADAKIMQMISGSQQVRCPKCGSNQIVTGQRGYSLLTGFLGSNKTVNRCAACGYSWQP